MSSLFFLSERDDDMSIQCSSECREWEKALNVIPNCVHHISLRLLVKISCIYVLTLNLQERGRLARLTVTSDGRLAYREVMLSPMYAPRDVNLNALEVEGRAEDLKSKRTASDKFFQLLRLTRILMSINRPQAVIVLSNRCSVCWW